jgi:hypothetical protein
MRRKHQGLAAIVIIIATVMLTGGYAWFTKAAPTQRLQVRAAVAPAIQIPDDAVIKEMGILEGRLRDIARPVLSYPAPVDLAPFGFFPSSNGSGGRRGDRSEVRQPFDYGITFAFFSKRKRFCVIDEVFYPEGAALPDGGKIAKIESRRVLIRKAGRSEWVPVASNIEIVEEAQRQ